MRAKRSKAKQREAMQSNAAKRCKAMQSNAMQSNAAKRCKAMRSEAMQSNAKRSDAKQCERSKNAKRCKAMRAKQKREAIIPPYLSNKSAPDFTVLRRAHNANYVTEVIL